MVKTVGSGITPWIPIPTLTLTSWMTRASDSISLGFSFLHCTMGELFIELRRKNVYQVSNTMVRHPESFQYMLLIVLQTTS